LSVTGIEVVHNYIKVIHQGWEKLFIWRVILRKAKTPASRKISLHCQYKYGKKVSLT